MTGDKVLTHPLTDEERKLCESYHHLIEEVARAMRFRKSVIDDIYDIGALALMAAARRYCTIETLRQYEFSGIAYSAIRSAYGNDAKRAKNNSAPSLDAEIEEGITGHDVVNAPECNLPSNSPATLKAFRAVKKMLTKRQFLAATLISNHATERDLQTAYGFRGTQCYSALYSAQKKCLARIDEIIKKAPSRRQPD